jgi:hypothetical protein
MSEDVVEYKRKGELKFIRLRSIPEDLIGYVSYKEDCVIVETPLRIEVETIFDEGRQILSLQEYLPQSVIELKEIEFYNEEVLFTTPVREEFYEQYEYVADFFYNNQAKIRESNIKKKKPLEETKEKVVSILEAMANKKDKPVH